MAALPHSERASPDNPRPRKEKIGSGAYGNVYKVITDGRTTYAEKVVTVEQEEEDIRQALREVKHDLDHKNIVKHHDYKLEQTEYDMRLIIRMEYCPGGSLEDRMRQRQVPGSNAPQFWRWIHGTLEGIAYLHGHNFVHRDIKPGNILISIYDVAKIADFGFLRILTDKESVTYGVGTKLFMSPEMAGAQHYNTKTDIYRLKAFGELLILYSFGVTLIQLVLSLTENDIKKLEKETKKILTATRLRKLFKGKYPANFGEGMDPLLRTQFIELIEHMLQKLPERRPSAVEISETLFVPGYLNNLRHVEERSLKRGDFVTHTKTVKRHLMITPHLTHQDKHHARSAIQAPLSHAKLLAKLSRKDFIDYCKNRYDVIDFVLEKTPWHEARVLIHTRWAMYQELLQRDERHPKDSDVQKFIDLTLKTYSSSVSPAHPVRLECLWFFVNQLNNPGIKIEYLESLQKDLADAEKLPEDLQTQSKSEGRKIAAKMAELKREKNLEQAREAGKRRDHIRKAEAWMEIASTGSLTEEIVMEALKECAPLQKQLTDTEYRKLDISNVAKYSRISVSLMKFMLDSDYTQSLESRARLDTVCMLLEQAWLLDNALLGQEGGYGDLDEQVGGYLTLTRQKLAFLPLANSDRIFRLRTLIEKFGSDLTQLIQLIQLHDEVTPQELQAQLLTTKERQTCQCEISAIVSVIDAIIDQTARDCGKRNIDPLTTLLIWQKYLEYNLKIGRFLKPNQLNAVQMTCRACQHSPRNALFIDFPTDYRIKLSELAVTVIKCIVFNATLLTVTEITNFLDCLWKHDCFLHEQNCGFGTEAAQAISYYDLAREAYSKLPLNKANPDRLRKLHEHVLKFNDTQVQVKELSKLLNEGGTAGSRQTEVELSRVERSLDVLQARLFGENEDFYNQVCKWRDIVKKYGKLTRLELEEAIEACKWTELLSIEESNEKRAVLLDYVRIAIEVIDLLTKLTTDNEQAFLSELRKVLTRRFGMYRLNRTIASAAEDARTPNRRRPRQDRLERNILVQTPIVSEGNNAGRLRYSLHGTLV